MTRSFFVIFAILFCGITLSAQPLLVQDKTYEKFNTISVEDYFVLKFFKSDSYALKLKTDERIAAHVQAYVKNGTLYLILDEKGYSPELKKQLRQKGAAAPVLEAEVYMPEITSVVLKNKAVITHCDNFNTETFTLTCSDHSLVSQLNVDCSTAEFNVSKNAQVTAALNVSSKLYLNTANSTQVSLSQTGGALFINQGNSSYVDVKATVNSLEVDASGSSESQISGVATALRIVGSGLTRVNTELLEVPEGEVVLTGSAKTHVNVSDRLKVNLTGGSMLTFKRSPRFIIERVVNSTLIKADDTKRK